MSSASLHDWLRGPVLPVLLNSAARRARAATVEALQNTFERAGVPACITIVAPAELEPTLRALRGTHLVAVAGGDGSISTAATALAGSNTVLLPIPLGKRNHFARRHGLSSLQSVMYALDSGTVLQVAVGEVNGRAIVNNASCGLYAHYVRRRDRWRRIIPYWPTALLAASTVGLRRPLLDLELTAQGRTQTWRTAALWIGMGAGSLHLPGASRPAGQGRLLELIWPRVTSRAALLALGARVGWQLYRSGRAQPGALEVMHTAAVTVRAQTAVEMAVDGEVERWTGPLHFCYRTAALRVLRPSCGREAS